MFTRFGLCALATIAMVWSAQAVAQGPQPVGPIRWDRLSAGRLLTFIRDIDSHGLEPADYAPVELGWAIATSDVAGLDRQADASFARVARDLVDGHVPPTRRVRFYIPAEPLGDILVERLIRQAIASTDVAGVLNGLAPRNPQYAALRVALAALPAAATTQRRKIEASLERWRWMPQVMGQRHLLVNIPEYRLRLVAEGRTIADHRVIVGKRQTPTPQFSAEVTAVVFNPAWHVPQSIIAESVGSLVRNRPDVARARGYIWDYDRGSLQVIQQPGPQNALGQMKLDMENAFSVYIHDTSNRDLFDKDERVLSHGCIRTDKPFDLAVLLLAGAGWTRTMIDEAVATRSTRRVPLDRPLPVYTVYMPAYVGPDGTVSYFGDPYALDAAVNRLLDDGAV